jgi:hypothetical protein
MIRAVPGGVEQSATVILGSSNKRAKEGSHGHW